MDSKFLKNISTDCSTIREYMNVTYESPQEKESKVEYLQCKKSESAPGNSNFLEAKVCKICLLPYFGKNCSIVHVTPNEGVEKTGATSSTVSDENVSDAYSKSQICSKLISRLADYPAYDFSAEMEETSTILQDVCSYSSFRQSNSVSSKVIGMKNPDYRVENQLSRYSTDGVYHNSQENHIKYCCPHCSKQFSFRFTLQRHLKSHNIVDASQGSISEIVSQSNQSSSETSNNSISCTDQENIKRDSPNQLLKEPTLHSNRKQFKDFVGCRHICPHCYKNFRYITTLDRHILSHKNKNDFQTSKFAVVSEETDEDSEDSTESSSSCCSDESSKIHIHRKQNNYDFQRSNPGIVSNEIDEDNQDSGKSRSCITEESKENVSSDCLLKQTALHSGSEHLKDSVGCRHTCPRCSKCFKFRLTLERHMLSHKILGDALHKSKRNKYVGGLVSNEKGKLKMADFLKSKRRLKTKPSIEKCPRCPRTFEFPSKFGPHLTINKPTCHLCRITFSETYIFTAHVLIFHRKNYEYFCEICKKLFKNKSYFKRHINIHMKSKPFFCKECGHSYRSSEELSIHICSYEKSQHQCEVCGKGFRKKASLLGHSFLHPKRPLYPCYFCDYKAKQRHMLKIHIERNHRNHDFQRNISVVKSEKIDEEYKNFAESSSSVTEESKKSDSSDCFIKPITLHSASAKLKNGVGCWHICPHCSKCFKFKLTLERHILSHKIFGDALHKVKRSKYVELVSSEEGNTKRAYFLNSEQKPKNKICIERWPRFPKTFEFPSKFGPHLKINKPTCHLCRIAFSETYLFTAHVLIFHRKNYEFFCEICKKIFKNKSYFKRHIYIHMKNKPFFCKECGHSYRSSEELSIHFCSYEKSRYQCKICFKCFRKKSSLIGHSFLHPKGPLNPCYLCDYTAKQSHMLKIHIEKNHRSKCFQRNIPVVMSDGIHQEYSDSGKKSSSITEESKNLDSSDCLLKKITLHSGSAKIKDGVSCWHTCPHCSKCFKFQLTLERHIFSHKIFGDDINKAKRNKYVGLFSNEKGNSKMTDFLKSKRRPKGKICIEKSPLCPRTFEFPSKFGPHLAINKPTCHLCHITFSEMYIFTAHVLIFHRKNDEYFCEICKKLFKNKSYFKRHINIHMKSKPFFCNQCGHSYRSSKELSIHICTYAKTQYQCKVCGKGFRKKSSLIGHSFLHQSEIYIFFKNLSNKEH